MQVNIFSFLLLLLLYFSLGLISGLNNLLTPIFKQMFAESFFMANLVSGAFFSACFFGSLLYALAPKFKLHSLQRLTYRQLILLGLALAGSGCFMFIPAAIYKSYAGFLIGLFITGLGFTYVQIALTPAVLSITPPEHAGGYLSLAGGLNSFATTVAPLLGIAVFSLCKINIMPTNIKYPYIILVLMFIILLVLMFKYLHIVDNNKSAPSDSKLYALEYKQLRFGMLAIFFYVGAETTIGSNLITYLESPTTIHSEAILAGKMLAFYWGGSMIGRFLGFVALSQYTVQIKLGCMTVLALSLTLLIAYTSGVYDIRYFVLNLLLFSATLLAIRGQARKTLMIFTVLAALNILIASNIKQSAFAAWALISVGLFNSVMWPNILNLALSDLGIYRKQGTSLLITMVSGGAVIPLILGKIADNWNIAQAFMLVILCYCFIFGYSFFYPRLINRTKLKIL